MGKVKQISNPFSGGGGGSRFEVQVQSAFAALMLAGGFAPCLPCLPIKRIRLQAHQAGFTTDDFVAYVADLDVQDERRLLAQIKHGIRFTKTNKRFGEAIAAAWRDFHDPASFRREKDAIAVITGPLSASDIEDTRRILDWSRSCASSHEFFEKVNATNFSSNEKRQKLAAFRFHINAAAGTEVREEKVFDFIRHFHILAYDLDIRAGLMHALLHAIVGRHYPQNPAAIWARILEHVTSFNQDGGTLTPEKFPEDVQCAFAARPREVIPASLAITVPPKEPIDWNTSEFAEALSVANLLGGWQEGCKADMAIVASLTDDQPSEWLRKMREILQHPETPLSHANGVWTVKERAALWNRMATRVFPDKLKRLKECATVVLSERDPKFDLEPQDRFAAQLYGKVPAYSWAIRNGLAETLALLGTNTAPLPNAGPSAGEATAMTVVHGVLDETDWQLWASLDYLLPTLAEAAPNAFLNAVETALKNNPCPFDSIFAQERPAFSGGNYMTGTLWALETLAWDEHNIVRVSVILAILAARDPGGTWGNRPINSLTTIFLPWFPQTLASIEKRLVAVKTVVRERREIGWHLLMSLLPKLHSTSSGTNKPKWGMKLTADESPRPTDEEYWEHISSYAKMAIDIVHSDPDKLQRLVDSLDSLPLPVLDEILAFAESDPVINLPDEQRLPIWNQMSSLVHKHRRYSDAKWALPPDIVDKIDRVTSKLEPKHPTVVHRVLFSNDSWRLYDEEADWAKRQERLFQDQLDAVKEIFAIQGIESVLAFMAKVENAKQVGFALGRLQLVDVANVFLPELILSSEAKRRDLVHGFVLAMWQRAKWAWFDQLNTKSWSNNEIAKLLTYLPFEAETWKRADRLLDHNARDYWTQVPIHTFQRGDPDYLAVDALLKHGRPRAAVSILATRLDEKLPVDPNRAMNALLQSATSSEEVGSIDTHQFAILIKSLQENKQADRNKLMSVEWAYMALLAQSPETNAKTLNESLAKNPDFFCEVIRLIFRSNPEELAGQKTDPTEKQEAIATNAYRLLEQWRVLPGTNENGNISSEGITDWIDKVKASLKESGHLEVGLQKAGEVLIHSPADPDGLFMDHAVARVLDREDMDQLRRGYALEIFNSRGVHFVDPTGAPERELSAKYNHRADAVENAGYYRLAATLRSIANDYLHQAERVIAEHGGDNGKK